MEDLTKDTKISIPEMLKGAENLVHLTRENEVEMREFFNQIAMQSKGVRLLMQRNPRFYDFYEERGGTTVTLGLRDTQKKLIGMGTMVTTPCFVNGKKAHFGYMCDLRVDCPDPVLRKEWRTMFAKFLQYGSQLPEAGENCYMVTALLANNIKAKKLIESQVHGGKKFVPLAEYSMVNLLVRKPFFKITQQYEITKGDTLEEIEDFLSMVHQKQAFGFNFGAPDFELQRRLKTWKGFSLDDFYVVRDQGRIVAVTALWNSGHSKQTIVEGFGFKKSLEFLHMTHLSFDWRLNRDQKLQIFEELVQTVWPEKSKRKAHALTFCDFKDHSLQLAVNGYLKFETKLCLYMAIPENSTFKKESLGMFPPAFEMALA